jgi:bisphosphoglycerate-dependent phosphoglycerate mutase
VVVRVYIVRHGETQENREGVIQGQRDTALNANGMEQAWMVGEALKDAKLGAAFSSDLGRAVKVRGSNQTRDITSSVRFGRKERDFVSFFCFSPIVS